MPLLFDIVETRKFKSAKHGKYEIRLLKQGDTWGVDSTITMEPSFGYDEEGARRTFERICKMQTGVLIDEE